MKYFLKSLFLIINLSIIDYSFAQNSNQAAINVSAETRAKFEALLASDPAFKNKAFFKKCLDGSISDPYCEKGISGYIENHIAEKEVDAERAQVDAERAHIEVIDKIIIETDISLALIQIANNVIYNESIAGDGKVVNILNSNKIPLEIKNFINYMKLKKEKESFFIKSDYEKLLLHLNTHIGKAEKMMSTLTIKNKIYENLTKQIALMKGVYQVFLGDIASRMATAPK